MDGASVPGSLRLSLGDFAGETLRTNLSEDECSIPIEMSFSTLSNYVDVAQEQIRLQKVPLNPRLAY